MSGQVAENATAIDEKARALHIKATSRPGSQRKERIAALTDAKRLVEKASGADPKAARCLAQIVNSLAKELSKSKETLKQAKGLFQQRRKWEFQRQLNDPHGYAMALGGLGRLKWFASSHNAKTLAAAKCYFAESLKISEQICDRVAQVKLHSFLGGCFLETDGAAEALAHYKDSAKLGGDRVDQWFSGIGLLRCYAKLGQDEEFETEAGKLQQLLNDEGVPADCRDLLRDALQGRSGPRRSAAVEALLAALGSEAKSLSGNS